MSISDRVSTNGSLFGPRLDPVVFFTPLFLAGLVYSFVDESSWFGIYFFIAIWISFDLMHVLSTVPVAFRRYQSGRLKLYTISRVIFLVTLVVYSVFLIEEKLFYHLLAYVAIYHNVIQQYGWMMISRKKAEDQEPWLWDLSVLLSLSLAPLIWWHSELSTLKLEELNPGDLIRFIPAEVAYLFMGLASLVIGVYIFRLLLGSAVNLTKMWIFLATGAWFGFGLIWAEDLRFLIVASALSHGLPYIFYSSAAYSVKIDEKGRRWSFGRFGAFSFSIFVIALIWNHLFNLSWESTAPWGLKVAVWLPAFFHYSFDALIWKKSYQREIGI